MQLATCLSYLLTVSYYESGQKTATVLWTMLGIWDHTHSLRRSLYAWMRCKNLSGGHDRFIRGRVDHKWRREREEGSWTMDIDGPIEYCLFQHCKCRPSGGFCLLCKMVVMLLHCCTKHYKQDWIASKFCGQSCLIDVVNAITNLKQPCRRNPLSSNRQGPIRMTSLNSRQMTTEGETFELCRWRRLHRDGVRNFKVVWFRFFD